jgi:DNA-binding transcriptional MocR family regulator
VIARPLSHYYLHQTRGQAGLVLGYGSVETDEVAIAAQRLARVVERVLPADGSPAAGRGLRNPRRARALA